MQENSAFSLLFPDGLDESKVRIPTDISFISSLSAEILFDFIRNAARFKPNQQHPMIYFTRNNDVIKYRLDVVEDILHNDSLFEMLNRLLPELEDMKEIYAAGKKLAGDTTSALYTIFELYLNCIQRLYDFFRGNDTRLLSAGMRIFASKIKQIRESGEFNTLKEEAGKITYSIRNIKSITVGINLYAELNPVEAGIVSINTSMFQSGHIIDKVLRLDLCQSEYNCLAPLQMVRKGLTPEQSAQFRNVVNSTLNNVLKSSVKSWQPAIRKYAMMRSHFLIRLADEIRFLLGGLRFLKDSRI
jgi:hypothetical protein